MELRINTESPAARAIIAIAHAAGTAEIYLNTLSRLSNAVLFNQDDIGMDDTETIDTLRVLSLLRNDIQDIAHDKTIAHLIERADNDTDEVKTVFVVPYDLETVSHAERPGTPWDIITAELKHAMGLLALDATAADADIIHDVNALIDRVSSASKADNQEGGGE